MSYSEQMRSLIASLEDQAQLGIDLDIQVAGRVPTNATSEFLINKEQGDWAERLIAAAINNQSSNYFAMQYGRQENLSAGDDGFAEFYSAYQAELNDIGKKPDLLIFSRSEFPGLAPNLNDPAVVSRAVAAFEVRSSSFLEKKYRLFMGGRIRIAIERCQTLQAELLADPLGKLLKSKDSVIHKFISDATPETFRSITFRRPNWRSTEQLRSITEKLSLLKEEIKILQTRDFLSITPKVEDIALVSRWIGKFNVPHFYVQVFFDCAFALPFERILSIPLDSEAEESGFRIEKDTKNQNKTTVKINVDLATELVSSILIPSHQSDVKELARGRLLFFIRFDGESGVLDASKLEELLQ